MSSDFTVETFVFIHELFLFSVGMSLSHPTGINVHGVSSLRGGAWSGSSVSSVLVAFSLGLLGCQSKGFVKSCFLLTELGGGQPLLVGFPGLFFPFLEGPWRFCIWIEVRGMYDCPSKRWFHGMFESFDSSLVV